MAFGICTLSVVPLRSEPYDQAEMTSQVLFGELLVTLENYGSWQRVRLVFDNYEGWIDQKQYLPLKESEFHQISNAVNGITTDLVQVLIDTTNNKAFPIVIGSALPRYRDGHAYIQNKAYQYEGSISELKINKQSLTEHAYLYLHTPYLWGGRTPFGIDCSGFVQMVYKLSGVALSRDASQQSRQGETIHLVTEAETGDLAFFDNPEGEITHVGFILPDNKIIHASGKVRIDQFDHQGIYNHGIGKYTHNLRLIKRLL